MSARRARGDADRYNALMQRSLLEAEVDALQHVVDWLEEHPESDGTQLLEIASYELQMKQEELDNLEGGY